MKLTRTTAAAAFMLAVVGPPAYADSGTIANMHIGAKAASSGQGGCVAFDLQRTDGTKTRYGIGGLALTPMQELYQRAALDWKGQVVGLDPQGTVQCDGVTLPGFVNFNNPPTVDQ